MKVKFFIIVFVIIISCFCIPASLALYRDSKQGTGSMEAATWSVTRNHSASGDSLNLIPDSLNDDYTLTVQSNSEVDVYYSVIISNLPTGVEVSIDNGSFLTPTNNTITINNVGLIRHSDQTKTRSHILTFRATSSAETTSNQQIHIDVKFQQTL